MGQKNSLNTLNIIQCWKGRTTKFCAGLISAFAAMRNNFADNYLPTVREYPARTVFVCYCCICYLPLRDRSQCDSFLGFLDSLHDSLRLVLLTDFIVFRRARNFNVYHLYKPQGVSWYGGGANHAQWLRSQQAWCRRSLVWCIKSTLQ